VSRPKLRPRVRGHALENLEMTFAVACARKGLARCRVDIGREVDDVDVIGID
jgi:hypothetical protein